MAITLMIDDGDVYFCRLLFQRVQGSSSVGRGVNVQKKETTTINDHHAYALEFLGGMSGVFQDFVGHQ